MELQVIPRKRKTKDSERKPGSGAHPNSQRNLPPVKSRWGEVKQHRDVRLTDTGYGALMAMAKAQGVSFSDLLECLARSPFVTPEWLTQVVQVHPQAATHLPLSGIETSSVAETLSEPLLDAETKDVPP